MFYKIEKKKKKKKEFRRIRLSQKNVKFSIVPALKHILTDPGLFFGSVLHQLQFNILLIVCYIVEIVLE